MSKKRERRWSFLVPACLFCFASWYKTQIFFNTSWLCHDSFSSCTWRFIAAVSSDVFLFLLFIAWSIFYFLQHVYSALRVRSFCNLMIEVLKEIMKTLMWNFSVVIISEPKLSFLSLKLQNLIKKNIKAWLCFLAEISE